MASYFGQILVRGYSKIIIFLCTNLVQNSVLQAGVTPEHISIGDFEPWKFVCKFVDEGT